MNGALSLRNDPDFLQFTQPVSKCLKVFFHRAEFVCMIRHSLVTCRKDFCCRCDFFKRDQPAFGNEPDSLEGQFSPVCAYEFNHHAKRFVCGQYWLCHGP